MHRERLERLAALLDGYREDSETRFDLGSWGKVVTRRGGFLWLQKHTCNTAACAVGLACFSNVFAVDGLRFQYDADDDIEPAFKGRCGWSAVKYFFDLTDRQANRLFDKDEYRIWYGEAGAQAVARRIRAMIKPRQRKPKVRKTDISCFAKILSGVNESKQPTKVGGEA